MFSSVQQDWSSIKNSKSNNREIHTETMNKHWHIWLINNNSVPDLPRRDAVVFRLYIEHDCINAHLHTLWLIFANYYCRVLNIITHNNSKIWYRNFYIYIKEAQRYKFVTLEDFAANMDVSGAKERVYVIWVRTS